MKVKRTSDSAKIIRLFSNSAIPEIIKVKLCKNSASPENGEMVFLERPDEPDAIVAAGVVVTQFPDSYSVRITDRWSPSTALGGIIKVNGQYLQKALANKWKTS